MLKVFLLVIAVGHSGMPSISKYEMPSTAACFARAQALLKQHPLNPLLFNGAGAGCVVEFSPE